MKEVLDSRFFSAHFGGENEVVLRATRAKLAQLRRERRGILPAVVIAELADVTCRGEGRSRAREILRALLVSGLEIVPLDAEIAAEAGLLRCTYRDLPIADAIVAAIALRADGRVISDDPHFRRIKGLRVAWVT